MYIERLDDTRLLIVIDNEDIVTEHGALPGALVEGLVMLAAVKAGLSVSGKRITAELLRRAGGYFIIATVTCGKRITAGKEATIGCLFKSAADLYEYISRAEAGGRYNGKLYRFGSEYCLFITAVPGISRKIIALMSEFGRAGNYTKAQMAHIAEQSEEIWNREHER